MLKQIAVEYKRLPVYNLLCLCNSKPEIMKFVTENDFIYDYPLLTFQFESGNKYFFFGNRLYQELPTATRTLRTVNVGKPLAAIKAEFNQKLEKSGLDFSYVDDRLFIMSSDTYRMYQYDDYRNAGSEDYANELEFMYHTLTLPKQCTPFTSIEHIQYYFYEGVSDEDIYMIMPFLGNSQLLTNPLFLTNSTIPVGTAKEHHHHTASFIFKPRTGVVYLNQFKDISLIKNLVPLGDINKTIFLQPCVEYLPVSADSKAINSYLTLKKNFNNLTPELRKDLLSRVFLTENNPNYIVGTIEQLVNSYVLKIMQYVSDINDSKVEEMENLFYPSFKKTTRTSTLREVNRFHVLTELYNNIISIISKVELSYDYVYRYLYSSANLSDNKLSSIFDVLVTFNKCVDALKVDELQTLIEDLTLLTDTGKHADKIPSAEQFKKLPHTVYKGRCITCKALAKIVEEADSKFATLPDKSIDSLSDKELLTIIDDLKPYDRLTANVAKYLIDKEIDIVQEDKMYKVKVVDEVTRRPVSTSSLYIDANDYLTFSNIRLTPTEKSAVQQCAIKEAYIGIGKYLVEEESLAGILQRDDNSDINLCMLSVPKITQSVMIDDVEYLLNTSIDVDDVNIVGYHQSVSYKY